MDAGSGLFNMAAWHATFPDSKDWAAKQFFELVSLAYSPMAATEEHQALRCDLLLVAAAWLDASWSDQRDAQLLQCVSVISSFERLGRSSPILAPLQGSGLRPSTP